MQKWEVGMTGDDFVSTKINIWVHIHGLPYELRRPEFAVGFANYACEVIKPTSNKRDVSYEGEFMKFRIALNTNEPILHSLFLRRISRRPTWIYMKYECLPNVCYNCGRLNHETNRCKQQSLGLERRFGKWLKADDPTKFSPEWSDEISENNYLVMETTQ